MVADKPTELSNQGMRQGSYELDLVLKQVSIAWRAAHVGAPLTARWTCIMSPLLVQASKQDEGQPSIASALPPPDPSKVYDVAVIGAGPAGLFLASELSRRGVSTVVIGERS